MKIKFDQKTEIYTEPEGDISGALTTVPPEAVLTVDMLCEDENSADFNVIDCTPFQGSGYLNLVSRQIMNVKKSLYTEQD